MERLDDVIQRRSTIEAKMIASIRGIENAYVYADKALASAFGCRLQSNGKRHNVGSKDPRIHPY